MVSALVAGPAVLPASAHDASRPLTACAGSAGIRFSPGLSLWPRHTRIAGSAHYTCTGTDPGVKWAESVIKGSGETSCLSIASTAVELVTWNTGEHSKMLYRQQPLVQAAGGQVVSLVDGTVIEGKYKGRSVSSPGLQITLDPLDCATKKGVELVDGPTTLVIV
ncbi:hypothetical protein [Streptomyces morookaense]|uniref:Uncharacterized protein n=1 Tax=Streptomyces morookaense TaxID=1970 RepID=A0A7Y7EB43_STRMO|nr:hypothetical protein [Streptomyces morookaense]NVK82186.1 hypothetical protein [Streptomyces morookaense]GHF46291.1 hypothetical protein GCM10010359_55960 [Streptomyces morookaense]